MKSTALVAALVVVAAASFAAGQETGKGLSATYDSLADVILGAKKSEKNLVVAILQGHRGHAAGAMAKGDFARAAAEMALFAGEGDSAVAGVRNRLVEGGHHHHADGEAKGIYEPGFVVVTKAAKKECLAASMELQKATDAAGREAAWKKFDATAASLFEK